jgi:hypothetical protein
VSKGSKILYEYLDAGWNLVPPSEPITASDQLRAIQKERYKIQAEKLENNRWLRENARDELILEKIIEAVNNLKQLDIPDVIPVIHNKREYSLLFGDAHFGVDFEIKGLFGETLSKYNPEIFESRMWDLLNKVVDYIRQFQITHLNVFEFGDFSDGILRVSQLMKLRYGVIEGTIYFANFISNWLNKLSEYTAIEYQMVEDANHTQLRLLDQPKGTFEKENTSLFVKELIQARLQNNPNFKFVCNPTGMIFKNICGFNFLGFHGEIKNLEQAIKDFTKKYNTTIHILSAGHLHHSKSEAVGLCSDTVNVPSIVGVDPFSFSISKLSNAGATILGIEEGKGKVSEENLKLN